MASYYVNMNAQSNGDHEVHKEGCNHMPYASNQKYLGSFTNCFDAVAKAKQTDPSADGCFYCCRPCNKG